MLEIQRRYLRLRVGSLGRQRRRKIIDLPAPCLVPFLELLDGLLNSLFPGEFVLRLPLGMPQGGHAAKRRRVHCGPIHSGRIGLDADEILWRAGEGILRLARTHHFHQSGLEAATILCGCDLLKLFRLLHELRCPGVHTLTFRRDGHVLLGLQKRRLPRLRRCGAACVLGDFADIIVHTPSFKLVFQLCAPREFLPRLGVAHEHPAAARTQPLPQVL
mmetsp:Transcript_35778/g.98616  ORF Transcript_35778/g.98616 Transcript_35778/m.98616 type:complete len:217 (-) Transcript_35778:340-990(-)